MFSALLQIRFSLEKYSFYFFLNKGGQPSALKAPAMHKVRGRARPQGPIVRSLTLHFCKRQQIYELLQGSPSYYFFESIDKKF